MLSIETIRNLKHSSSSTVLFVSHDDVVDSAFDRVLEIDELHAL